MGVRSTMGHALTSNRMTGIVGRHCFPEGADRSTLGYAGPHAPNTSLTCWDARLRLCSANLSASLPDRRSAGTRRGTSRDTVVRVEAQSYQGAERGPIVPASLRELITPEVPLCRPWSGSRSLVSSSRSSGSGWPSSVSARRFASSWTATYGKALATTWRRGSGERSGASRGASR